VLVGVGVSSMGVSVGMGVGVGAIVAVEGGVAVTMITILPPQPAKKIDMMINPNAK
jgi:hypothetical protein